ncbi:hypothetical protein M5D96_006532 [Drosophila gunungcola]|uniref:Exonuclease domain-containing protein n=1 Tax=Drosophila gunungcola TaxID=103775 RepID=A0A9P9YQ69_9MUSC|nr:hypothetical protein M5D96_006532 [Drosophila gunungcola]
MMWTRTRQALRSIARSQSLNGKRTRMKEQLSAKQHERNEKKKKKLAALANLMELNDRDRLHEAELSKKRDAAEAEVEEKTPTKVENGDDGFTTVGSKRKARNRRSNPEQEVESGAPQVPAAESTEPAAKRSRNHEAGGDSLPQEIGSLSEDQYKQLSAELRRRKRQIEDVPGLRLREMGQRASLETPQDARTPIFLTDIQNLLMTALIGQKSPCRPDRWCSVEKWLSLSHSVVVILEGLSLYHYLSNESQFEATNRIFSTKLEMLLPPQDEGQIIDEIAKIPLTNVQARKLIEEHGSLESAPPVANDLHADDKFPRTKLLLSALQMVDEGYPIPMQGDLHSRFREFKFTKNSYEPVTNRSPMFGVDCEMCQTAAGFNELTRISIVNEEYKTVYETLVLPDNRITNYLTQFSGITEEIMRKVTKKLDEVQQEVSDLLPPDAILVGHVCFNISGVRRRKSKLKHLAATFLKETIQENDEGHDSIEDSRATLKLVKMKLANSIEFGDEILTQQKRLQELANASSGDTISNNLFAHVAKRDKRTAIVTVGDLQPRLKDVILKAGEAVPKDHSLAVRVHEVSTSKEAVRKVSEIALENALTIANLRVPEQDFVLDSAERNVAKLDKTIDRLWNSVAHNGLFLVLMGGSKECTKGVAKIAIKRLNGSEQTSAPIGS